MKKKTIGWIAGGLTALFVYGAGVAMMYPANQEKVTTLYNEASIALGLREAPPAPVKVRNFITAGFSLPVAAGQDKKAKAPEPAWQPAMTAQGCSTDNKVVRLAYDYAIIADENKAENLNHPTVLGNIEKYKELRSGDIAALVQSHWQDDVKTLATLDLRDQAQGDKLQTWLNTMAQDLYKQQGLKVAFRVNTAAALDVEAARTDAIDACTPDGVMPPPLKDPAPTGGPAPEPF